MTTRKQKSIRTNPRRVKTSGEDRGAAQELELYAENSEQLVRSQRDPIILNLLRKYAAGTVDWLKSRKLWEYWMESAAQAYVKEFGGGQWFNVFTPETRRYAALQLASRYERAIKNGEYDYLIEAKGGIHAKRLAALRAGTKSNPRGYHNIEKLSGRDHYTGYADGPWTISKHGGQWLASKNDGRDRFYGATLAEVSRKLEARNMTLPPDVTEMLRRDFGPKKSRRKNPADAFIIVARKGGKRLTFDANRNRFTDNSKPSLYRTATAARERGMALLKQYPILADYKVTIEAASAEERGAVFGARPRINPDSATDKAYRAWRRAAEKGYGERDHSYAHMQKVDARIRRLKAKYEAALARPKK
ncbi:MAG: hypothetical protein AB7P97_20360 [Hyphomonadaceae bacterium]